VAPELPQILEPAGSVEKGPLFAPELPRILESADFAKPGAMSVYELPRLLELPSFVTLDFDDAPQPTRPLEPTDLVKYGSAEVSSTANSSPTVKLRRPPISRPETWESPWSQFPSVVPTEPR